jgi:hypothetical protein
MLRTLLALASVSREVNAVSVEPVPRREIVTRSPTRARRVPANAPHSDAEGWIAADVPRVRSLIRSQFRSSLISFALLAVPTALLPVLLTLAPSHGRLSGPALSWVILGFAAYPLLVLLAWWHVRRAERHERDFARKPRDD